MRLSLKEIYENNEYDHKAYLKWKRKNVTIRGAKEIGKANGSGGMLGLGLYTAPLGNRALAKQYGKVYFLLNAIPKSPVIVDSLNNWEIWAQKNLFGMFNKDNYPSQREFFQRTTIEDELTKMGYDGVIIKGREMVNFTPPDNIMYFDNERELQTYYTNMILN